jgi:hypothetical protein
VDVKEKAMPSVNREEKRYLAATLFFLLETVAVHAQPISCVTTPGLAVDADGAPDSYRVDGHGLSYTCDGVFAIIDGVAQTENTDPNWQELCKRNWEEARVTGDYSKVKIVGFLADEHDRPVVQGRGDPLPGQAFVTTTALTIPRASDSSQHHYVDASAIPYVVLSPSYASSHHLRVGDLVAVYRPKTGRIAYGVYADCCSLGEASIRLHRDLGNDPIVMKADGTKRAENGIEDRIEFIALTGVHTTPTLNSRAWRREIKTKGDAAVAALGGVHAIKAQCR